MSSSSKNLIGMSDEYFSQCHHSHQVRTDEIAGLNKQLTMTYDTVCEVNNNNNNNNN
jgi:hypothetical protein